MRGFVESSSSSNFARNGNLVYISQLAARAYVCRYSLRRYTCTSSFLSIGHPTVTPHRSSESFRLSIKNHKGRGFAGNRPFAKIFRDNDSDWSTTDGFRRWPRGTSYSRDALAVFTRAAYLLGALFDERSELRVHVRKRRGKKRFPFADANFFTKVTRQTERKVTGEATSRLRRAKACVDFKMQL